MDNKKVKMMARLSYSRHFIGMQLLKCQQARFVLLLQILEEQKVKQRRIVMFQQTAALSNLNSLVSLKSQVRVFDFESMYAFGQVLDHVVLARQILLKRWQEPSKLVRLAQCIQ